MCHRYYMFCASDVAGGRQVLVRLNRGPPPVHQGTQLTHHVCGEAARHSVAPTAFQSPGDLPLQGHLDPARLLRPGQS